MSKKTIILIVIAAILLIVLGVFVATYNSIVSNEETVNTAYSNIKVMLLRRADLIPNLVEAVKGYIEHEQSITETIADARKKMSNANSIEELSEANEQITSALNSLNVIVENYPDLKASENFLNLQDELAGTENRIATARQDYNESVRKYNSIVKRIPGSIVANMFGFSTRGYFELDDASKEAVPGVKF